MFAAMTKRLAGACHQRSAIVRYRPVPVTRLCLIMLQSHRLITNNESSKLNLSETT